MLKYFQSSKRHRSVRLKEQNLQMSKICVPTISSLKIKENKATLAEYSGMSNYLGIMPKKGKNEITPAFPLTICY